MDTVMFGKTVNWHLVYRDADGDLIDPATSVSVKRRAPNGVETAFVYGVAVELTRLSLGTYKFRFKPSAAGIWTVRAKGVDGSDEVAEEAAFSVSPSSFLAP